MGQYDRLDDWVSNVDVDLASRTDRASSFLIVSERQRIMELKSLRRLQSAEIQTQSGDQICRTGPLT